MKKKMVSFIILIMFLVVSVIGCNNSEKFIEMEDSYNTCVFEGGSCNDLLKSIYSLEIRNYPYLYRRWKMDKEELKDRWAEARNELLLMKYRIYGVK